MNLKKDFIPIKPFPEFKWQWASVTCTESLNDPVILLGVLSKMHKLEGKANYSSVKFSDELEKLQNDVKDSITVNLAGRGGERNLIRNSGQYWKALGLIDKDSRGLITLTSFGRNVANHKISQTEFSLVTIKTLTLPNPNISDDAMLKKWNDHDILIHPLMLILKIYKYLYDFYRKDCYITAKDLIEIIIPLSATKADISDYANFILWNRKGKIDISKWADFCPRANDKRMAREFLLFLNNYGYIYTVESISKSRYNSKYFVNELLLNDVLSIDSIQANNNKSVVELFRAEDIPAEVERKKILSYRIERPNQTRFRKNVLKGFKSSCILTNTCMSEVLEAAHIKPVKYNGNDSVANGLCMRLDIHQLFDTGHLRINIDGNIILSDRAKSEYNNELPQKITIPNFVDRKFLRWRIENYNGI